MIKYEADKIRVTAVLENLAYVNIQTVVTDPTNRQKIDVLTIPTSSPNKLMMLLIKAKSSATAKRYR
ncbi:hypothetical protein COBT_000084 [Conglomerata obtusa]